MMLMVLVLVNKDWMVLRSLCSYTWAICTGSVLAVVNICEQVGIYLYVSLRDAMIYELWCHIMEFFYCNYVCPPLQHTIYILIILHQQLMLCSESHGYTVRLSPVMYSCKCEQIVDSWCVTPHLSLLVSAGVGVPNSLIGLLCVVK